jgi:mRNA-degrading endonuclease toxin of MazEF toxin-antitoxin module
VDVAGERRKALADQITTISKQRMRRPLGTLSEENLEAVARVVCIQLNL